MSAFLATLETIDKPTPTQSQTQTQTQNRISRLPPTPSIPIAGPSSGKQRYLFVAVRRGRTVGVFDEWSEAERSVSDYPDPVFKTFSTRLAAEAFVAGWDGVGRHSLPGSSPKPLREHLAMNFPSSVPTPPPTMPKRASYHARLLVSDPNEQVSDFGPRPLLKHSVTSYRASMVRISSPLTREMDDVDRPKMRKVNSVIGLGGLLSPPMSPEGPGNRNGDRSQPNGPTDAGLWASSQHRRFPAVAAGLGLLSPPNSPPTSPKQPNLSRQSQAPSPLWADIRSTSPLNSNPISPTDDLPKTNAPKFSRSGLKKTGIIMPVAAPRTKSTTSLRSASSSTSLSSLSSSHSTKTIRNTVSSDRLWSLAETSKRELQLNDEGLLALSTLPPPRPAFMRRNPSNSSIASTASSQSAGSMTSGSSLESYPIVEEPIPIEMDEEVVQISCTRSDGDADGSVESSSVKSGKGKKEKRGGLFKRLSKAIGLEKKSVGQEDGRRGSM